MQTASHIHDDTKRAFATLWSWLRRAAPKRGDEPMRGPEQPPAMAAPGIASETCTVLRFPLRGEALLVRLAELLRRRVERLAPKIDCLTLVLSHQPRLRLWIDDGAYVEFDAPSAEFHLMIETPSARMIIQTADFDAVVKFVMEYVVEKMSDATMLEVAS